ncbi:hypothetical protein B0H17DRAFT_1287872 [Mycena rosella]|uniref:Uncharacterized protein n=1 Tax=Mycena rosella TaxID=1033263 RepID=A0AAD7GWU7_MYCRO|nr:hypothetical protein B0H17DRAFT_1287872 [Mycena rosella]
MFTSRMQEPEVDEEPCYATIEEVPDNEDIECIECIKNRVGVICGLWFKKPYPAYLPPVRRCPQVTHLSSIIEEEKANECLAAFSSTDKSDGASPIDILFDASIEEKKMDEFVAVPSAMEHALKEKFDTLAVVEKADTTLIIEAKELTIPLEPLPTYDWDRAPSYEEFASAVHRPPSWPAPVPHPAALISLTLNHPPPTASPRPHPAAAQHTTNTEWEEDGETCRQIRDTWPADTPGHRRRKRHLQEPTIVDARL